MITCKASGPGLFIIIGCLVRWRPLGFPKAVGRLLGVGYCYYCREPGCCCRGHDDCPTNEHYEKVGKKYATTTVIAARIKSPITTSKNGVRRLNWY